MIDSIASRIYATSLAARFVYVVGSFIANVNAARSDRNSGRNAERVTFCQRMLCVLTMCRHNVQLQQQTIPT